MVACAVIGRGCVTLRLFFAHGMASRVVRRALPGLFPAARPPSARCLSSSATQGLVRSSTSGLRCTIFGAYGFVGRYVTALMAGSGTQCVIPFRGDDMEWRHLKVRARRGGSERAGGRLEGQGRGERGGGLRAAEEATGAGEWWRGSPQRVAC